MKMLLLGVPLVFLAAAASAQTAKPEIDASKILWHSHLNASKYFGKPIKILKPRIAAEGWDYEYRRGSGTVGTRSEVLLFTYRYKNTPASVKEALKMVGLPTDTPPMDLGTSYIWNSSGTLRRPMYLNGKKLNRVILAKDLSEISVDGHEPGTY